MPGKSPGKSVLGKSVLDHISTESPYEHLVKEELAQLQKVLLHQHTLETKNLKSSNERLRKELEKYEAIVEEQKIKESLNLGYVPVEPLAPPMERWAMFAERLMEDHPAGDEKEVYEDELPKEELHMRSVWKVSLQEMMRRRHHGMVLATRGESDAQMRMNEAVLEDSCLQKLVVYPRSSKQLIWSTVGSFLILWDLVTIPLGIFDLPDFIKFLTIAARVSFFYWLIDMPLHFLFGIEIGGAAELRPSKLARRYFQSWFLIDLLVLTMDASIILVETFGSFSENESTTLSPFHSARFLRALRLLRLLRLMRVAKLQQEMMVLANRFLTTHTFMLMKVVAGVCMLLLINHIIACSWYGIGTWEFEGRSWLARLEIPQNDFAESYAASMHWALTQFTPATNNIAPDNAMERFFALGVVVFAIGIFSSFITQITTTMSSLRMARSEQNQKRAKLLQFFSERGLSVGLFGKVQQALQQEGHFEVRLKEPDVMLIQKIPERLKMQLHEEMFRNNLLSLNIWPSSTKDNEYFLATICHHAMQEHSAVPGQDVFLPGTDCHDVYVIESGSMGYVTVAGDLIGDFTSVQGGLCLPCLWCEWTHRGRLAATMGICYYARLRCDQFCTIVQKFGGPLFQFLQIFGIFLVSEIEAMDQQGVEVTDVNLDEELLKGFGRRAERFARMQKPGMSGNHTIAFQHTQTQSKLSSSRRLERKVEKIDEVLLGEAPEQPPEQPAAPALASQASQVAISIEPPRWADDEVSSLQMDQM